MASTLSPCIGVCLLDPALKLCLGCGRTLDEIAAWGVMRDTERRAVMADLPGRLAAAEARALDATDADP